MMSFGEQQMQKQINFIKRKVIIFKKIDKHHKGTYILIFKNAGLFLLGGLIGFILIAGILVFSYINDYRDLVYIGVSVDGRDFSGKKKSDIYDYFAKKSQEIGGLTIEFETATTKATVSAQQIGFGFDEDLMAGQAYSAGRSSNFLTNLSALADIYFNGSTISRTYRHNIDELDTLLQALKDEVFIEPQNALFAFENGRVTAFSLAQEGAELDMAKLKERTYKALLRAANYNESGKIVLDAPIKRVKPKITNENVNTLGIRELVGQGKSLFTNSIENRIYNISLAASRLNGKLIAPGETFSFNQALGDISAFTGYKKAYIIENGRTVLGDGGGVCQVSTTLFRAALNAGLPITERSPHAYRVSYYEQDSEPGIDAAVYSPSPDLKFKNDTGRHMLIQTHTDLDNSSLTFYLYGARDGREVEISEPVITSQTPAPEPLYQDDPGLPKDTIKQIDFAASGASVYFKRTVTKDGEVIISDTFKSYYRPWQAIFLRGTAE